MVVSVWGVMGNFVHGRGQKLRAIPCRYMPTPPPTFPRIRLVSTLIVFFSLPIRNKTIF